MIRVITLGDQRLHQKSEPAEPADVAELVEQLFAAMHEKKGIGLAAVQVGTLLRVFVTKVEKDRERVFINPEIVETSIEEETAEEGCLSIPGVNADVTRPGRVSVQAQGRNGRTFRLDADGLLARAVQHELDHLNGILFIDRIDPSRCEALLAEYQH